MSRQNDFILKLDKYVGKKIYDLRLAKGLSRNQLADQIGVTHQQLQKYEKGTNRITIGRLALIARAFKRSMSYFYEGFEGEHEVEASTQHQRMCIEISRNFMRIKNKNHQASVNELVKSLVENVA